MQSKELFYQIVFRWQTVEKLRNFVFYIQSIFIYRIEDQDLVYILHSHQLSYLYSKEEDHYHLGQLY